MPTSIFDFANGDGQQLSGVLETGHCPVRAYALFAHCFTCDKSSLAATRVSRALADRGIAVLRFDFTGLGESAGEFGRGLSGDVQDIVCATRALDLAGMAPRLLIGHSFGGAAVLAAAGSLNCVEAVAVIGAPFNVEHVLNQVVGGLEAASAARVPVTISGRAFSLSAGFTEDLRAQDQDDRIANLRRALLVLHSPTDAIVSIENAAKIFGVARHPKSFISLDRADHMLSNKSDAQYVADVIAAWSSRYLAVAAEPISSRV